MAGLPFKLPGKLLLFFKFSSIDRSFIEMDGLSVAGIIYIYMSHIACLLYLYHIEDNAFNLMNRCTKKINFTRGKSLKKIAVPQSDCKMIFPYK